MNKVIELHRPKPTAHVVIGQKPGMFALVNPKGKAEWVFDSEEKALVKYMQRRMPNWIALKDEHLEYARKVLKASMWTIRKCNVLIEEAK